MTFLHDQKILHHLEVKAGAAPAHGSAPGDIFTLVAGSRTKTTAKVSNPARRERAEWCWSQVHGSAVQWQTVTRDTWPRVWLLSLLSTYPCLPGLGCSKQAWPPVTWDSRLAVLLRPDSSHCQPVAGGFVSIHVIDISSDSVMGDCRQGSLGFSRLSIVCILTMTLWSWICTRCDYDTLFSNTKQAVWIRALYHLEKILLISRLFSAFMSIIRFKLLVRHVNKASLTLWANTRADHRWCGHDTSIFSSSSQCQEVLSQNVDISSGR